MAQKLSEQIYRRALNAITGGVNSPVRAFKAVGGKPMFVDYAKGPYIYDADGNKYIDYIQSWGASILGHADPDVVKTIRQAAEKGTSFGLSSSLESELAGLIKKAFPSIELLRMVNSGTEAVMSAVRLARGYTGRNKVLKFEGCYHGHSDSLLAKAGSGIATFAIPDSAGIPASTTSDTIVAPYNNLQAVKDSARRYANDIACIIVEPIAANMGVVLPEGGFLEGLRLICDSIGAVLIFDEVITGFRIALGGAQELYDITPDLTTLGKVFGGGLPVGAFGGKQQIMKQLAPTGPVYQAGTFSGNPVVCSAGIAVISKLFEINPYQQLEKNAEIIEKSLRETLSGKDVSFQINRAGSMFTVFFNSNPVTDYKSAKGSDADNYAAFFRHMLSEGVLLPPSQFEACFLSLAHSDSNIEKTVEAARKLSLAPVV